jgi:methionyl-tRNA synthetase
LPGWDDRRLYVWFDAVIGYLSASLEWADATATPTPGGRGGRARRPATATSSARTTSGSTPSGGRPSCSAPATACARRTRWSANHHLTLSGGKLSASRGHALTIDEGNRAGSASTRCATPLCALGPETADVELAWDKVAELTASGLLGAIAGPPHRVATLLWRRFGGRPDPAALAAAGPSGPRPTAALAEVGRALDRAELRRALGRSTPSAARSTAAWPPPSPGASPTPTPTAS